MKRLILYTLMLFWCCVTPVLAYTPPIGIPDPGFGIDNARPARPADWSNYVAGYYYVDLSTGNNTTATSMAGGYGTPTYPRLSIPSPVPAGSYVEVHGTGALTGTKLTVTVAGTNAAWVAGVSGPAWIVGQDVANRPNIRQTFLLTGSYGYLDGLYFSGGYGAVQIGSSTAGYPANHIVLRNTEIAGDGATQRTPLTILGHASSPVSDVIAYNNSMHDAGDMTGVDSTEAHATVVSTYASNVWVLNNAIHTSSGSGAQVGYNDPAAWSSTHNIYYGFNHVYNTRAAGLAAKGGVDIVFSQNNIHDQIDTNTLYALSASESKGIGMQYMIQRIWVLHNTIYDSTPEDSRKQNYGIRTVSFNDIGVTKEVYVIGNVIYNIEPTPDEDMVNGGVYDPDNPWSASAISLVGGDKKVVLNNTIFNVCAGLYFGSASTPYYAENNIVSGLTRSDTWHLLLDVSAPNDFSTLWLNNNVFYQNGGGEKISPGDAVTYTVAQLQANGHCIGCSASDPQFVNASGGNLQIGASSPAKDTGLAAISLADNAYATFQSLYGIDIKKDIAGTSRPVNSLWDIGAYEYTNAPQAFRPRARVTFAP